MLDWTDDEVDLHSILREVTGGSCVNIEKAFYSFDFTG